MKACKKKKDKNNESDKEKKLINKTGYHAQRVGTMYSVVCTASRRVRRLQ